MVEIEVIYARPEEQVLIVLSLSEESTVGAAILASGLLERFPEIGRFELKAGIFGVICKLDRPVIDGDRIEIYRALVHDPKEARRQRALKNF